MKQGRIEGALRRVNDRLVQSMDSRDKQELIEEFKSLYSQQMKAVSLKISRVQKVTRTLHEKQQAEDRLKQEIKDNLDARMEAHFKKREHYQEGRLQNFRQVELRWKDKLRAIGEQIKQRQKHSLMLSKQLSKEALLFWETRDHRAKDSARTRKASQRYRAVQSPKIAQSHAETRFLTEVDLSPKEQLQQEQSNFPSIRHHYRIKTEGYMDKHKSQSIKEHILRSNDFWKSKEEQNFQRAMQKMQHIESTRHKAKQKLFQSAKKAKQERLSRQDYHSDNSRKRNQQRQRRLLSESIDKGQRGAKAELRREDNSSKVQQRRLYLKEQQFEQRSKHFEMVMLKERKRGYRRMVKEGVNLLKLQALKGRP